MKILTNIPFIGKFNKTSIDDHKGAIWELMYMITISIMPLWVAFIALKINAPGNTFYKLIQNGELYVYCATTLAPVFYLITKDRDNSQSFPSKHWYILSVLIIAIFSAIIITTQRLKYLELDSYWIIGSIFLYLFSIFILYTVFVYNNMFLFNPSETFPDEERDFIKKLRLRR